MIQGAITSGHKRLACFGVLAITKTIQDGRAGGLLARPEEASFFPNALYITSAVLAVSIETPVHNGMTHTFSFGDVCVPLIRTRRCPNNMRNRLFRSGGCAAIRSSVAAVHARKGRVLTIQCIKLL